MSSSAPSAHRERRFELIAYGAIIVVAVLAKTLFTVPVEVGGDAIHKWEFVVDILRGAPWSEFAHNHHTARWGINLPTLGFAWMFGTNWFVYYLTPLFFYLVFLILAAVFFARVATLGVFSFTVFVLILFGDSLYFRSTTQLQPFIFVAAFVLAHVLSVYRLTQRFSVGTCFLAAFFIFLAYGAKATALFYAPATIVFVFWAMERRTALKAIGLMAVFGVLLLLLETAAFSLLTGEFTTRVEVMHRHFHSLYTKYNELGFLGLFGGWTGLDIYPAVLFALTAVVGGAVLYRSYGHRAEDPRLFPILLFVSFAILETFVVKSIDPIIPLTPPKDKYLADLVPWACMVLALTVDRMVAASPSNDRRLQAGVLACVGAICLVSILATPLRAMSWMWRAESEYAYVADKVRSGIPIRGNRKSKFYGRVISASLKGFEYGGEQFWVYRKLDTPTETLVAGECFTLKRLNRGNLRTIDCLPQSDEPDERAAR